MRERLDAYRTAIIACENELQNHFSNNVTITVSFGYANLGSTRWRRTRSARRQSRCSYATLADALVACHDGRRPRRRAHCRVSIRPAVQDFWSRVVRRAFWAFRA